MNPKRIQLKRTKGWRKPDNTVVVSRPSMFGNPFDWREFNACKSSDKKRMAKKSYELWLKGNFDTLEAGKRWWIFDHIHELRGKNLACWCKLGEPCHADILLELANN